MTANQGVFAASSGDKCAALVAGASGGLGEAIVRKLSQQDHWHTLFAIGRSAEQHAALLALAETDSRIRLLSLDPANEADLEVLADTLAAAAAAQVQLTLVCNCTGLLHDDSRNIQPEKRLAQCSVEQMSALFQINALVPLMLLKTLVGFIPRNLPAVMVSFSARVGSISDNRLGGWYSYRASKAAHNMLMKTAAIEFARTYPQMAVVCYHPGTVDTSLSKPFQRNVEEQKLFSPEQAADFFMTVLAQVEPEHNGCFLAWDGQPIPW